MVMIEGLLAEAMAEGDTNASVVDDNMARRATAVYLIIAISVPLRRYYYQQMLGLDLRSAQL